MTQSRSLFRFHTTRHFFTLATPILSNLSLSLSHHLYNNPSPTPASTSISIVLLSAPAPASAPAPRPLSAHTHKRKADKMFVASPVGITYTYWWCLHQDKGEPATAKAKQGKLTSPWSDCMFLNNHPGPIPHCPAAPSHHAPCTPTAYLYRAPFLPGSSVSIVKERRTVVNSNST